MALPSSLNYLKGYVNKPLTTQNTLAVTTLGLFRLHISVLLPCEWWGRVFLNHSNIEAVLIKRQPGDSPRTTKPILIARCSMCIRCIGYKFPENYILFHSCFCQKRHAGVITLYAYHNFFICNAYESNPKIIIMNST